jgi:hypothetical protein
MSTRDALTPVFEFRWETGQDYQLDAIAAATDLFDGMGADGPGILTLGAAAATPNRLQLDESQLLTNLRLVQARNGLPESDQLELIEQDVGRAGFPDLHRFPNFSI